MTRNEFRQHLPALRLVCAKYGPAVAYGNRMLSDATGEVWADAIELGASHLSPKDRMDLDRWIGEEIGKAVDPWMPAARALQEAGDRSFERVTGYMRDWCEAQEVSQ
jgi:hypothetical protein